MPDEPTEKSRDFVARALKHITSDRGAAAALRRGLSESTRHYAYSHVIACGGRLTKGDDRRYDNPVDITIAALMAVHPRYSEKAGNFGHVCRKLREQHESFDARFRRLLSCRHAGELCEHLKGFVLAAKQRDNLPVDYARLRDDATRWHWESTRVCWAEAYWGADEAKAKAEAAAAEAEAKAEV